MPIGATLAVAGATVYAVNSASDSAAAAQQQSAQNAQLSADYADPYHSQRAQWQPDLNALMGHPSANGPSTQSELSALQSSPSYQFRYNQGLQALNSSLAAKGLLNSGNRLAALTNYGQNFASGEYQNQFNRLSSLSGNANANMGAAANNYSQNAQLGVGYGVAGNNAMSQGLGQLAGMYKNGDLGGSSSYGMPNYSQATSGDGLSSGTWGGMGGMGDYGFSATTL